jgi:tetratricopeptide (TPR) repeat protein
MAGKSKIWALLTRDFVSAGDLYYRSGNLAKAAELYARAGNFGEAARLSAEAGHADRAVDFYLKAGSPRQAGELLAARNQHKEAIPYFERAEAYWQAAESALKLKQPLRAARFFEKSGARTRAAECFEMAGEIEQALRLWTQEAAALEGAGSDATSSSKLRQVDMHRSKVLIKLGRYDEAAEILGKWGLAENAAPLLERSGQYGEAVRAYLDAGQVERALALLPQATDLDSETRIALFRRCGRHAEAAGLYEELGQLADAAEAFEAAGQWTDAGRMWETADEPGRAAELFYRAGEYQAAARCYEKAKNLRLAAETYAKVDDAGAAARCFLEIDEPLRAAKYFIKAGDKSAASDALQSIPSGDPDFEEATLILVPLLVRDKLFEGALHRLQLLPERPTTVGAMAVERLYWEARIHDALGNLSEAESLYQKAIALRRDHRDLAARLEALRTRKQDEDRRRTGESGALFGGDLELEKGQVLQQRYEVLEEIGRGGMSRVYKARDRDLDEEVAIKILRARPDDQLRSEERLLREVQICRRITHPNVVRVYDIGRLPGGIFVTMELLDGHTLDRLIGSGERLSPTRVKGLLSDILKGLREAHELKIIHRDLKPANVALTTQRAKIMDFGIAQIEDTDVNLTQTGQVVGSPMYMSPEQIQGQPLGARSDLYSLGVLAYTLLAGNEPFTGTTATAISLKHLQEPPPDICDVREDLAAEWSTFIQRLLAKQPADRYQSAAQVLSVVERLPE